MSGVLENFGATGASEIAAVSLMAGLGILFLERMTFAGQSALFILGILAWLVSGLISYSANAVPAPQDTLELLMLLLLYGLFANACFAHLAQPTSVPGIYRFIRAFILVGGALAIFQVVTGTGFVEEGKAQIQRAFGSDVHPVSFAIQMVAALVVLECIRSKTGQHRGLWYITIMAVGIAVLYLTYARTAWIMALITLAFAFSASASRPTKLVFLVVGAPILLVVLVTSDRFSNLNGLSLFLSNFTLDNLVFDYRYIDNSVSWRIVNWGYGFQQALEKPMLGFGPGQSASSSYFNLEMHNIFLETFFEGGVFGLAAFLILLSGLFRIHRLMPRQSKSDHYCCALANGFGLSLLLAVFFSTSFVDQLMSFILYFLLLTIAAIPSHEHVEIQHLKD